MFIYFILFIPFDNIFSEYTFDNIYSGYTHTHTNTCGNVLTIWLIAR